MQGWGRESPKVARRTPGAGVWRGGRMRSDWGVYDAPGAVYSLSDVAGVVVEGGGEEAAAQEEEGVGGAATTTYGFTSTRPPARTASTHSLPPPTSPPPRARLPTNRSHDRDSSRRQDEGRGQAENGYRSAEKRGSERSSSSRTQQEPQSRRYSGSSRGEYSPPSSTYRSLRGYSAAGRNYEDRQSLETGTGTGQSGRYPEYWRGSQDLRRSSGRDYTTSTRRVHTHSTHTGQPATRGILATPGKYGASDYTTPTRTSLSGTSGYREEARPYSSERSYSSSHREDGRTYHSSSRDDRAYHSASNGQREEGRNYTSSRSYNREDTRTYPTNGRREEGKGYSSASRSLDRRSGLRRGSSQTAVTSSRGSQTELSIATDVHVSTQSRGTKGGLQAPEGVSSASSRRSSSSTQQVTFSTTKGGAEAGLQERREGVTQRGTTSRVSKDQDSPRSAKDFTDSARTTKDDQQDPSKTSEDPKDMSNQWGGRGGAGGQWSGAPKEHYHQSTSPGYQPPSPSQAPPLPRPPMPPQHYPGHDEQGEASLPPDHGHHSPQDHNHTYHNHNHSHAHHSRHHSAGSSRQPLVRSQSSEGRKCRDCMTRVPYATLIATLMCCVGVGVFCGTMYRGTTLTLRLFEDVFKLHIKWDQEYRVEPVQLTFMVVGAGMGGLGLMILFVGCLSTGDTRNKVYRTWRGRVGGRISCAIFMGITYLLSLAWLLMFAALIIVTLLYTLAWFQCINIPQNECIDYNQFSFMFPEGTLEDDKRVCSGERKLFCKDYVNNAEIMFILATVSAFLVILSLVHYLMCLAANYAHIKDQEKFIDLQEIQFLHESEMSTLPKDRF